METESIFKTAGVVLAAAAFLIFLYKIHSIADSSDMTQEALVKELALTADAMMKNNGAFTTNYNLDVGKFEVSADDKNIIVKYGLYPMKYPYFKADGYKLVFEEKGSLIMKKVKE